MSASSAGVLNAVDRGPVRVLSIDRSDRLNALNAAVFDALEHEIARAGADRDVRVLVITGTGEKAFSAGADLEELAGLPAEDAKALLERGQGVTRRLEHLGKPVLAAVQGYALGGGLELALACTMIVGSTQASFGLPESRLGLIPGYGGTQRLPRVVGRAIALRMMLTGDRLSAEEAYAAGLLALAPVAPGDLLGTVDELAGRMARQSPSAHRLILQAVYSEAQLDDGLMLEATLGGVAIASADGREGVDAFLEKRRPNFGAAVVA
jgi:enoyl-CoA hydratase